MKNTKLQKGVKNMYLFNCEPRGYADIDFDKLEKLLNSIDIIEINIDLRHSLEQHIEEDIEELAERHIDGEEYKTLEDVLNDKDKIYSIKDEAKTHALNKASRILTERLDILKNIINTKIYFINQYMKRS